MRKGQSVIMSTVTCSSAKDSSSGHFSGNERILTLRSSTPSFFPTHILPPVDILPPGVDSLPQSRSSFLELQVWFCRFDTLLVRNILFSKVKQDSPIALKVQRRTAVPHSKYPTGSLPCGLDSQRRRNSATYWRRGAIIGAPVSHQRSEALVA